MELADYELDILAIEDMLRSRAWAFVEKRMKAQETAAIESLIASGGEEARGRVRGIRSVLRAAQDTLDDMRKRSEECRRP